MSCFTRAKMQVRPDRAPARPKAQRLGVFHRSDVPTTQLFASCRYSPQERPQRAAGTAAYMLMEALVYIGLVVVMLGLAFMLLYRLVDNSVVLRRNAEDIASAMRAGERWRADIRNAQAIIGPEQTETGAVLRLQTKNGTTQYRFDGSNVWLQGGDQPWVRLVQNVQASEMRPDRRTEVTAWQWNLEMGPRSKGRTKPAKLHPLFTFTAVPSKPTTP